MSLFSLCDARLERPRRVNWTILHLKQFPAELEDLSIPLINADKHSASCG